MSTIATKTREESQIKSGMVKKRMGVCGGWGVFLVFIPPSQRNDAAVLIYIIQIYEIDDLSSLSADYVKLLFVDSE